jgi:hypothetical protein
MKLSKVLQVRFARLMVGWKFFDNTATTSKLNSMSAAVGQTQYTQGADQDVVMITRYREEIDDHPQYW